jgi:cytochrome b
VCSSDLHWSLVLMLTLAWVTGWSLLPTRWHDPVGYGVATVVSLRLVWGFVASGHARFSQFVRPPAQVWVYLRLMRAGQEPRHLGHNPLGGWMILCLLGMAACCAFTGWLCTTDRYWGVDWVSTLHQVSAISLLVLVPMHITGVLVTSWRQGDALVRAMITGRKPQQARRRRA